MQNTFFFYICEKEIRMNVAPLRPLTYPAQKAQSEACTQRA